MALETVHNHCPIPPSLGRHSIVYAAQCTAEGLRVCARALECVYVHVGLEAQDSENYRCVLALGCGGKMNVQAKTMTKSR